MDGDVNRKHEQHQERASVGDFAALFAELERSDACAPLELGLRRMCGSLDVMRRTASAD